MVLVATSFATVVIFMSGAGVTAQDATPAVGSSTGGSYPVAIHQGSCEMLTEPPIA